MPSWVGVLASAGTPLTAQLEVNSTDSAQLINRSEEEIGKYDNGPIIQSAVQFLRKGLPSCKLLENVKGQAALSWLFKREREREAAQFGLGSGNGGGEMGITLNPSPFQS